MTTKRILLALYLASFVGCASTPNTIDPQTQFGWVLLGASGGNHVLIPNLDVIPAYNIYRQSGNDSTFVFVTKEKRPSLPMRNQLSPYSIEWVDLGNSSVTKYKVLGLKDDGTEWFVVNLEYRVPKEKSN